MTLVSTAEAPSVFTVPEDRVVFDLESDGLLDEATKVHTIGWEVPGEGVLASGPNADSGFEIVLGALRRADCIVGHNIIGFDIPLLQKLYPGFKPEGRVIDTLVLSRLAYPHLFMLDFTRKQKDMPKNLWGSHSLKAWGIRLGILKGDFGETNDWSEWSQEMEDYCKQDVRVTCALLEHLEKKKLSAAAVEMEMQLQHIICAQERHGFCFDIEGAQRLAAELEGKKVELLEKLQEAFPPIPAKCLGVYGNQKARMVRLLEAQGWEESDWESNMPWLLEEGIKFRWTKEQPFNPNSGLQIIERLKGLGWEPTEFTEKGQPKMDEPVLIEVGQRFPDAAPLVEFSLVEKRLGQITQGQNAWLKLVGEDGRMHGRCNTMGTVTFRFTHSKPNMGQVPGVRAPYGEQCRGFFHVPDGFRLVGCDVSGLELRLLAHYMARWDKGEYAREILEGDIHTRNQELAGLPTRDAAKTFIYALLYGAGDAKLGTILHPEERSQEKLRRAGKHIRAKFMKGLPALAKLSDGVRKSAGTYKRIKGLDGRAVYIRSAHSALNALIQSAGSIATKRATVHFRDLMQANGYAMGEDWCLVAHVHDEWQTEVRQEIADDTALLAVRSIEEAGDILGLRCPITGEAKVGGNWAETH